MDSRPSITEINAVLFGSLPQAEFVSMRFIFQTMFDEITITIHHVYKTPRTL